MLAVPVQGSDLAAPSATYEVSLRVDSSFPESATWELLSLDRVSHCRARAAAVAAAAAAAAAAVAAADTAQDGGAAGAAAPPPPVADCLKIGLPH